MFKLRTFFLILFATLGSPPTGFGESSDSSVPTPTPSSTPTSTAPPTRVEESHPGMNVETTYAEAVLAFNQKDFDKALKALELLLLEQPNHIEALELQALAFKIKGLDSESLKTYLKLLEIKPEPERAPYHFEVGVFLFKQKKLSEARSHLEFSYQKKFNLAPSLFFLGLIALSDKKLLSAENYFSELKSSGIAEFEVAAHFYLGMIYFQNSYPSGATFEWIAAKDQAKRLPQDATVGRQVGEAAAKALLPFDKSSFFANVSSLLQYDTNLSLLPDGVDPAQAGSGKASVKALFSGAAGWMSSPLKFVQVVPGFRIGYNKNFAPLTQDYEFLSLMPSLYLNFDPLARTTYGLKIESGYTFQFRSTLGQFQPYSGTLDAGLFLRSEVARKLQLGIEASVRPGYFYTDLDSKPSSYRSGYSLFGRAVVKKEFGDWLRPESDFSFEWLQARGSDYQGWTIDWDLSNAFRITGKDTLLVVNSLIYTTYPSKGRNDGTWTAKLGWVRPIFIPQLNVLADLSYTLNRSTLPTDYTYSRFVIDCGLSFTF